MSGETDNLNVAGYTLKAATLANLVGMITALNVQNS
ncbi:hypothetical protein Cylst_2960 [Cylindrospermum stagnale PCC 7417]|uniref:Uncharacterized protein n=1 Tax=Cylindrospermum stagnale PCC 7417 TaxID=56107 RepID=K9X066_9NOST|nr:hypothetical protein Cylst_2960 [Cylindrospermum stagnale PCC 7417]